MRELLRTSSAMTPRLQFNKVKTKILKREKSKKLREDHGLGDIQSDKDTNILDLSKLVPHSSQMLCSPEVMMNLTSDLKELEISSSDFPEFSQLIDLLKNLQKLLIKNTILPSLPDSVGELKNLNILEISNSNLVQLPDSLSQLKNLQTLNIHHNKLKNLPDSFANLQRLRELDISHNCFKSLPKCIANGMGTLRILDASKNENIKLNIIPQSRYLEKFIARDNKNCKNFPDWLLTPKFFNVKEINLNYTTFDVYSFIGKQGEIYLKHLSIKCSNLSSQVLDMMLENMNHIEIINVGNDNQYNTGNVFNTIPIDCLKNHMSITELNFRGSVLPGIPSTINKLCNLKILDIGSNNISWLPDEFCELTQLECLKIDGNGFIMFPANIGNLKSLQELRAQNNQIKKIPDSFKNLENLKFLDLFDNIFEEFPSLLQNLKNLQGVDFEQNLFSTNDVQINGKSYSIFCEMYRTYIQQSTEESCKNRNCGMKEPESISNDEDDDCCYGGYSCKGGDSSFEDDDKEYLECNDEDEENWDDVMDTDDEFDPNCPEVNHRERFMQCPRLYTSATGFCPADLHSERIKKEVASMRVYGSLPSFKIEEGQFDDA